MGKAVDNGQLTMNNEWKETEVGRIPADWNVKNLEENLDSLIDYRGKTPKKSENGIPTLSAKSVRMGYIDYSNVFYISEETYEKFMVRGFPKKGDILLTTEAPLGCVAILDRDYVGLAQRLITLRGKKGALDNNYLAYYLTSKLGQHELLSRASGTTVQGIKRTEFSKVNIIIPPLYEQEKIASILKSLDDKIELNNQMNQTLEEMAQSIFKEWFVDFNFPDEEGVPYKDNGGEMVESELGEIPKGWRVEELRNLFKFIKGKKPKKISDKKENYIQQQYLTIKSYTGEEMLFADVEKTILTEKKESVMVMDGASSGTIFYGKNGIVGSTIAKIETKNQSDDFIHYLLKFYENEIKQHLTGSAIPHTDKEFVYRIKIALPEESLNLDIFSNIRNKIIDFTEEIQTLIKTRDTLLPKLMSGEVRVL